MAALATLLAHITQQGVVEAQAEMAVLPLREAPMQEQVETEPRLLLLAHQQHMPVAVVVAHKDLRLQHQADLEVVHRGLILKQLRQVPLQTLVAVAAAEDSAHHMAMVVPAGQA